VGATPLREPGRVGATFPASAPRDADELRPSRAVHPIEAYSYRLIAQRVDLSGWQPGARDVVARMVHATADESFARTARIGTRAVAASVAALDRGAAVICDVRMVLAGITSVRNGVCYLDRILAGSPGLTRSAAAIDAAAEDHPDGALWVIGSAPTALRRVLDLCQEGRLRPAAVIGLPVGYVGAAETKAALWASPLQPIAITNVGERGGSPVAAAAVNALGRLSRPAGPGPERLASS
jgi:precorrin-8X/cobalt-precorrin-8 methylmutase